MSARRASVGPGAGHGPDTVVPRSARRPILDDRRRQAVQLYPGQLFASASPSVVTTILGSCVAVCLWDATRGIGGMNHFMLPDPVGTAKHSPRFGVVACARLIEELVALGSDRRTLEAKVFGGACVIRSLSTSGVHLGLKNVAVARAVLEQHHIPIAAEETGGTHGRKLVFLTDTGTAWVHEIVRGGDGA
ncbi:MAG TPA: chemotaxis protein CheD [Polyangiaceae bacterium]